MVVLLKEVIPVITNWTLCRRQFISERLQELRKEKFGNAAEGSLLSEGGELIGPSDPSEAPEEMQHFDFTVRLNNLSQCGEEGGHKNLLLSSSMRVLHLWK